MVLLKKITWLPIAKIFWRFFSLLNPSGTRSDERCPWDETKHPFLRNGHHYVTDTTRQTSFLIFHESFKPWNTIDNVHRENTSFFSTSSRILSHTYILWNFINVVKELVKNKVTIELYKFYNIEILFKHDHDTMVNCLRIRYV